MRFIAALLIALVIVSGCARMPPVKEKLMNEIERAVVLPKGARSLNSYGRNYAFSGRNKVTAVYLVPSPPPDPGQGCDVMLANLSSRPCTKQEVAESAASAARASASETPAGQRRWFVNRDDLPVVSDGGCEQVTIEFDTAAHRVIWVACNGIA